MTDLKFAIERPEPWLVNPRDGHRHRSFFSNLLMAVTDSGLSLETSDIPFGGDFAPRIAPQGRILLSYHSVGAAPDVWRMKESYIPPYYYFDRTGYSAWAQIAHDPELQARVDGVDQPDADTFVEALRARLIGQNESKYQQKAVTASALPSGYLFYPMQIIDDSVAKLARIDTPTLLQALTRESNAQGIPLVVKRHPLCKHEAVAEQVRRAEREGAIITDASVHELIRGARAVVTVNSGVGFEALVHGKPVFTAGRSDYEIVTDALQNEADIARCFGPARQDPARVRRFISFFLREYCVDGSDPASIAVGLKKAVKLYVDGVNRPVMSKADDFAYMETVHYFAEAESLRRRLTVAETALRAAVHAPPVAQSPLVVQARPEAKPVAAPAVVVQQADDGVRDQLMHINLKSFEMICGLYGRLSGEVRSLDDLHQRNRAGRDMQRAQRSFTANYYQELHDKDAAFQQNNWLVPYLDVFRNGGVESVRELGCGNGAFLRAVRPFVPKVIGVDWARSPQLPADDSIEYVQADITRADLPMVDVNCSADVLEHLPFESLPNAVARIHQSAAVNFHVIACYDDGHSHLSIFHPDEWLYLFRQQSPGYRMFDVSVRHNDTQKIVCAITNWPQSTAVTH